MQFNNITEKVRLTPTVFTDALARYVVGFLLTVQIAFALPVLGASNELIAKPEIFSPGIISGPDHDAAPAFLKDGKTLFFGRSAGSTSTILMSTKVDDVWSEPVVAAFSGKWSDMEPALSPDGQYLIFISNRPVDNKGKPLDGFFMGKHFPAGGGNLWRVDKLGDGWGEPVRLPDHINANSSTFSPSIAANGNLYFMRPANNPKLFQLFRARYINGRYLDAEPLSFSTGSATDVDPAIAPDESFLVFGSNRVPAKGMNLFITYRQGEQWLAPIHLGNVINSSGSDAEPRLSPDVKTLYFSSDRVVKGLDENANKKWNNGKYNIWSISIEALPPRPIP